MSIPGVMKAVVAQGGEIGVGTRPVPVPGPGELLVRVRAAGVNNADVLQAAGRYPAPPGWPQDVLGLELAGEVAAIGPDCSRMQLGKRVCAVVGGGAQAEYAIVPEAVAMELPHGVPWDQAGALPEAAATAWDALVRQGGLSMFERVLVTGAAGGVGSVAVQLGRARGASVVASTRTPQHDDALRELGAAKVVRPDEAHAHGPFDVVLELVGAGQIPAHVDALATGGRIVVIGVGAGRRVELDLLALMQRRGVIRGSTLRARGIDEHATIARELELDVLPMVADGNVRVPISRRAALDEIADVHASFVRGGKLGKFVLLLS